MTKFKSLKSILLTTTLTIGVSMLTSQNIFAATSTTKTYTVKSGDCLSSIAMKYGQSLNNLRKANNKWNDSIFPGQVLKISGGDSATVKQTTQTKSDSLKTYTVKSGDCLSSIAKKCGQSLNDLRKDNNKWNDSIFPGQVLKISGGTSSTAAQTSQTKSTAIKYTDSDLNLLARLITAEAGGESYEAQVAVGAIVVNRVKSSYFPNSIKAVINENTNGRYQFTPVLNGNINRPAEASGMKAAMESLNGNDPTNKALFFYSGATPKGLTEPQPVSRIIGNMTFVQLIKK
ncbi:LysM peptidoglycan-binding domain-containing protein [Clostridium sp. CM028]|uniref:LysM peptidoglycan-binding domain-containing protein n=1 Tax=unclassified Clostridium TaxID=2614128 RepID=UPI001C6DD96A|nr:MULTISPECIES: LysM peptidoglycan-binding domain-containing protein [unclassified Clostridium]MBW9146463.1 LysM peptidoglycan-binding domain-containing protein [Clostridium sp. CM027]MBW9149145.1 LysM peptidoglycan-binding domain-containing protein [Clostridium sp. CM028]UVE41964.1 LysM peptidoglycan-binding domain-containing protein [Clostridium sp. CM027]WLC62591.1 LysM peptidoglycan-binding domain-containing protein [Clostridium sp. CM028]